MRELDARNERYMGYGDLNEATSHCSRMTFPLCGPSTYTICSLRMGRRSSSFDRYVQCQCNCLRPSSEVWNCHTPELSLPMT